MTLEPCAMCAAAIALARIRRVDDPEAVEVVTAAVGVNHFDSATRQPERHRPERTGARPVHQFVHIGDDETLVMQFAGHLAHDEVLVGSRRQRRAFGSERRHSHSNAPLRHS